MKSPKTPNRKTSRQLSTRPNINISYLNKSEVTSTSPLHEVQDDDTKRSNQILDVLQQSWPYVEDIDDICKLSLTTTKVLESRRKLLNLQLGKDSSNGPNSPLGVFDD